MNRWVLAVLIGILIAALGVPFGAWTARAQQGEALAKRFKNPADTLQLVIMCRLQLNRRPEMDVSPSESTN